MDNSHTAHYYTTLAPSLLHRVFVKTRHILLSTVLLMFSGTSFADRIVMKNGKSFEGSILSEDDTRVVIQADFGRMNLLRKNIDKMERKEFIPKAPVDPRDPANERTPREMEGILTALDDLDRRKRASDQSFERVDEILATTKKLQSEYTQLKVTHANSINRLRQLERSNGVFSPVYARAYQDTSAIEAKQDSIESQYNRLAAEHPRHVATVMRYYEDLRAFMQVYKIAKETFRKVYGPRASGGYFRKVEERLLAHHASFEQKDFPATKVGDHWLANAKINGVEARLLVDTGATLVTVSESKSKEIGIPEGQGQKINAQLADGSIHPLRVVTVEQVAVGEFVARNVEVGVMQDPPDDLTDGLLGMSYLKNFSIHINPETGTLRLDSIELPGLPAFKSK